MKSTNFADPCCNKQATATSPHEHVSLVRGISKAAAAALWLARQTPAAYEWPQQVSLCANSNLHRLVVVTQLLGLACACLPTLDQVGHT